MESVNLFFIICWHEWNLWMYLLSVYVNGTFECFFMISAYINGICECFLYGLFFINVICECFLLRLLIHMESLDVLFPFIYMNGICERFFYGLSIWIESVKVFFNWKFIWIEHMCIFFIPCLNESNMWMFPLMLAYMCFSCGDLDSVQVAFIKIAHGVVALSKYRTYISFCLYCLYINLLVCQSNG